MKNMLSVLLPLSLLIATVSCRNNNDNIRKIRVTGEGKVRVMPNQVILTIDVAFTQPRMADAVRLTQETLDSVLLILEKFGDKNTDIKTSSISANKDYDYVNGSNKFTGYKAEQTVDFVLNDIGRFTDLTAQLLETKINSISQIQFAHSKKDSLFREADLLAYDDALKSANKLTDRASLKLGRILFISDDNPIDDNVSGYSSAGSIDTYSKAYGGRGFKISPEVIEFKRNIVAEYEVSNK